MDYKVLIDEDSISILKYIIYATSKEEVYLVYNFDNGMLYAKYIGQQYRRIATIVGIDPRYGAYHIIMGINRKEYINTAYVSAYKSMNRIYIQSSIFDSFSVYP